MNGPQHYAEAERLLQTTRRYYNGGQTIRDEAPPAENVARAQVHATLALAAATVDAANAVEFNGAQDHTSHSVDSGEDWAKALGA